MNGFNMAIGPPTGIMYFAPSPPELSAMEKAARNVERQARVARFKAAAEHEAADGVWLIEWSSYEEGGAEGVFKSLAAAVAYIDQRYDRTEQDREHDDVVDGELVMWGGKEFSIRRVPVRG